MDFTLLDRGQQQAVWSIMGVMGFDDVSDPDYLQNRDDVMDVVMGDLAVGTLVYDAFHACDSDYIPTAEAAINDILTA